MKRNICLIFAVLFVLSALTACTIESRLTDCLWYSKGSIIGLPDANSYDIHLSFNDDNTGHVQNIYEDNTTECYEFEYSAFSGYLTILSYNGKVLDKGIHTYPYSIENDVLTITIENKEMEFTKLTAVPTVNTQSDVTYEVLKKEHDRILEYMQIAVSGDTITKIYIDLNNNTIVVGLKELNDENIKFFRENISDAGFIVFEESDTSELMYN